MTQHARRLQNADQAFELYDKGDMQLDGSDGWDIDESRPIWTKNVYVRNPETKSSGVLVFVVRFNPVNDDVEEAYFHY
jgi:hypothetical protein